jgi:hypothetical protein
VKATRGAVYPAFRNSKNLHYYLPARQLRDRRGTQYLGQGVAQNPPHYVNRDEAFENLGRLFSCPAVSDTPRI